jgi:hypothetical protein
MIPKNLGHLCAIYFITLDIELTEGIGILPV